MRMKRKRTSMRTFSRISREISCLTWKKINIPRVLWRNSAQDSKTRRVTKKLQLISIKTPIIDEKEWRNTAFCMSLLPYNEKELRKLLEFFENYREKLNDPFIMDCFRAILTKVIRKIYYLLRKMCIFSFS